MTTTIPLALTVLCATIGSLLQSTVTMGYPMSESSLAHSIQSRAGSGVLLVPYPRVGKRMSALYNILDRESYPHLFSMLVDADDRSGEEKRSYLSADFGKRSDNEGEQETSYSAAAKRLLMARVGKRFLHAARVG